MESSLPERDGNEDRKGTAEAKIRYELLVARAVKAGKTSPKRLSQPGKNRGWHENRIDRIGWKGIHE